ncbi:MarR family transcriptional regulator [Candidatus Nitrotoga sp. HW29]|uniref:MarR family winged helix-turn-helix transcriptional regulator n=1 Tax=Candidatus Nitrotoga sp. HW29 TaxID=2886963 RepID=UPI001EF3CDCD|nr:MarR family winged helix-turn-helix transcriptional regulator [Candidatus Nitrotoga sp. HW29]CAH1904958.1 MarR family transcriptional regulator [Candidatus Nitrotoga sp. HW29]
METKHTLPWKDTPAKSERIVSAITRIASVLRSGAWQFATTEGLNPTQVDILEALRLRRAGVRLSWIAQHLGVTSASASDSITSLTAKGLIEKGRDSGDGRAVALRLTRAGQDLAARISNSVGFAHEAVADLPQPTQDALFESLLALIGKLQQSNRFPEIRACVTCKYFAANKHSDSKAPHHCMLIDTPLPINLLRLDCPEHDQAPLAVAVQNWRELESA